MPDFSEEGRDRAAEEPFPQGQPRKRRQPEPDPQVRPTDAEGGIEPAAGQLQADQELAAAQGPGCVDEGTQEHPRQKAAHQPPKGDGRGQKRRPRLRFGSS